MRDTFVRTLTELAKNDKKIELLTGDLGFGVLKPYWEAVPDQFTDAGIAEQNMTTVAAGMALEGRTVFTYSIGYFPTLRCLEQIRKDCAYHEANVKIVCVGGGLVYGSLGMSHHATEDLAVMRALPGVIVMAPGDPAEAEAATRAIAACRGTCYLRSRRNGKNKSGAADEPCIAVFSTGAILDEVCDACRELENAGIRVIQYSFPTVKPIDSETITACVKEAAAVFTIEEHNITGGFGSAVAEGMGEAGGAPPLYRIGLHDEYCTKVGSQQYLREEYGLSAEKIAAYIRAKINS